MKPIQERLAVAIRARRKEIGLSQEAMATAAGIHRTYAGSIENGQVVMSVDVAERLAAALELPLSDLFKRIERAKKT